MALRKKREEAAPEGPQTITIDFPIIPTEFSLGRLDAGGDAYAILVYGTILTSGKLVLDRSQAIHLGAELMKLAEKMPREKKLEVPGGLVVPG